MTGREVRSQPPDAATLAGLVEAVARARDRAAFGLLFAHFAPRIKAYMMRLGADPSSAEDLMQEAMVMVWRRAETFDRRQASPSTWIFTIARNKRIDALRRERRPELDPHDPVLVPAPPPPADERLLGNQRDRRVRAAIESLPPEQARLLHLAFYEGKSHRQIALDEDLPLGTVKSRLRLAFERLRRQIESFSGA